MIGRFLFAAQLSMYRVSVFQLIMWLDMLWLRFGSHFDKTNRTKQNKKIIKNRKNTTTNKRQINN